ncbi:hypothetical protein F4782DRAFT_503094 [Xylaria castorea]|nr:hypothetical protein F4782DRAFT_503094 [Xylaria castorea]
MEVPRAWKSLACSIMGSLLTSILCLWHTGFCNHMTFRFKIKNIHPKQRQVLSTYSLRPTSIKGISLLKKVKQVWADAFLKSDKGHKIDCSTT